MDNVATILIALGTGASIKASTTTTNEKVKDIYLDLREKILDEFRDKGIGDMALTGYEVAPAIWRPELKKDLSNLKDLSKANDALFNEIVDCAQKLIDGVEPERASDSKVIGTVQGYNQGSYQQVFMNFGSASRGPEQKIG